MAIVAVSSLLFACKNKQAEIDKTVEQPPIAVCPEPEAMEINIENGPMDVPYLVFNEFDARMVIPEKWMDDCIFTKGTTDNCDDCTAEYTATYGSNNDFLGAIDVFTTAQWSAIPNDNKGIYVNIADVNGYVYGYSSKRNFPE